MKNIAIFASGSGSNAQNIAEYFAESKDVKISVILSNREDAYVHKRAKEINIPSVYFNRSDFYESSVVLELLDYYKIDFVVLAGFLWLIPNSLINTFPEKILNIHPALLPNYGGKGMYGMKVHEAVKASGDKESGISIHLVNEKYDEGKIIFQAKVAIDDNDSPDDIAQKIHALEYEHFPKVIEKLLVK